MASLPDLSETGFDPDLHVLIRGKTYTIPAPDYETAKRMREQVVTEGMPPVEAKQQAYDALGTAFDEMLADDLPDPFLIHAGRTAICHFGWSPDLGGVMWKMSHLPYMADLKKVTDTYQELIAARKKAPKKEG